MSKTPTLRSKVQRLASLIENDVRRRGLVSGDAYLTAAQASKDFSVDALTATRAMSFLAKRGVLVRKQGVGTFIGDRIDGPHSATTLKYVHVIQRIGRGDTRWNFPVGRIVQALHDALPTHQVQSIILPQENPLAMVRELIGRHESDGSLGGMLMIRCSREIQQLAIDRHIPSLTFGKVYSTTTALPSIDADQVEAGRLATQRLMQAGHKRVVVLMRESWSPGDNQFMDGVHQGMSEAGATFDALITRSITEDVAAIESEIHRLLELENRPTGLICRGAHVVEILQNALKAKGLRCPEDLEIVCNSFDSTIATKLNIPCSCPELSCGQQAKLVAKSLAKLIEGDAHETINYTLPVKLFEPK